MKTSQSTTNAERAGRRLGRAWRGVARRETRTIQRLASKGLPAKLGQALFWIVKLSVFVVLLYTAFWLALLLAFAVVAAWLARNSDWADEDKPEWREGHSGFGLYDKNEWRHDMGDPDDP